MVIGQKQFRAWLVLASLTTLLALVGATAVRAETRAELIKRVNPSIVRVKVDNALGSGCVVDAALGIIATNFHVVRGCTKCSVCFPARKIRPSIPSPVMWRFSRARTWLSFGWRRCQKGDGCKH